MVIGCTGNYRKDRYLIILNKIRKILKSKKIDFFVSYDIKKKFN